MCTTHSHSFSMSLFFTFKRTLSSHRNAWAFATTLKHTHTHTFTQINISQVFQCDSKEFLLFLSRRFTLYARKANLLQIFRIANNSGCAVSKYCVTAQNEDIIVHKKRRQRQERQRQTNEKRDIKQERCNEKYRKICEINLFSFPNFLQLLYYADFVL